MGGGGVAWVTSGANRQLWFCVFRKLESHPLSTPNVTDQLKFKLTRLGISFAQI